MGKLLEKEKRRLEAKLKKVRKDLREGKKKKKASKRKPRRRSDGRFAKR